MRGKQPRGSGAEATCKRNGTSEMDQDQEPAAEEVDRSVLPAAQKRQSETELQALAAGLTKPVKKRKCASPQERQELLSRLPAKILQASAKGCQKCRWRSYCTVSCWRLRGYQ